MEGRYRAPFPSDPMRTGLDFVAQLLWNMDEIVIPEELMIKYSSPIKEFIISNQEYDLVISDGLPSELISCQYGRVLRFKRPSLPTPNSMSVWPNGCKMTFNVHERKSKLKMNSLGRVPSLTIFTVPDMTRIWLLLNGFNKFDLYISMSLSIPIKVPFFESIEFKREGKIVADKDTISFGDAVTLKIIDGCISNVHSLTPNEIRLVIKPNDAGRILMVLTRPGDRQEDAVVDEKFHVAYLSTLLRLSKRYNGSLRQLYVFSLNTSLSTFKRFRDRVYVSAGIRYSFPRRTYFRDSFWTVLPVLSVKPELVREQILTLATGVHQDGCPSAVLVLSSEEKDFLKKILSSQSANPKVRELLRAVIRYENDWWSDHHDSCAYFVLLVSEYYLKTGDDTIFREFVNNTPLEKIFLNAMNWIYSLNSAQLFRKPYDTNEWADNVFRNGVVTYVAGLHLAALKFGARTIDKASLGKPAKYLKLYKQRRRELNHLAFSREKGYFVNFKGDSICENLSLDVVIPIIYGVLDDEFSKSTLKRMERNLETRNNKYQPYGDWGVMCVWPLYDSSVKRFGKSVFPYRYHNGACWPYLSSLYALAKWMYGMEWEYPLLSWWRYSLEKGWVNLVEYYSPPYPRGSLNQGWSAVAAYVIERIYSASKPDS